MVALHAAPRAVSGNLFQFPGEVAHKTESPALQGRALPGGHRPPSESICVTSHANNSESGMRFPASAQKKRGARMPPEDCWGLASVRTPRGSHTARPQALDILVLRDLLRVRLCIAWGQGKT